MPNYCSGTVFIKGLTRPQMDRIGRRAEKSILCEQILPYPKDVKEDLEMEHKFWEERRQLEREQGWNITREQIEKLEQKYPHKQLRYDWRCKNWGSKWDLCYCNAYIWEITNDLQLNFETAWSPVTQVFQELSRKYKCKVYYEWSEPGCWFSGRAEWDKWMLIEEQNFDDPFFWEWVKCVVCGQTYDWRCEDDRWDMTKHICLDCYEKQWT